MTKVGIISQARMTSTRLPGKVLKPVGEKNFLAYHVERLRQSSLPIIIATTTNREDDAIVKFCQDTGISFFRGSENNVLERYYQCALRENLDIIIRVTSDCPLIDGHLIKKAYKEYLDLTPPWNLYFSNTQKRTYPRGFDFEIFSFKALELAFNKATENFEQEHVTPFIWLTHKEAFQIKYFLREKDASSFRITLDEEDDYTLLKELIEKYHADQLGSEDIIKILEANPYLAEINKHVEQKKVK